MALSTFGGVLLVLVFLLLLAAFQRIMSTLVHAYLGPGEDHTVEVKLADEGVRDPPALVVVIGWSGAKRVLLNHLLSWYFVCGVTTVSYVPPFECMINGLLSASDLDRIFAEIGLRLIEQPRTRVFLHAHSNTGAMVVGSLLVQAAKPALPEHRALKRHSQELYMTPRRCSPPTHRYSQ